MGAIYLVRHAQASFGAADYDVLSDLGHRQSAVLGEALKARVPRVTKIVSGAMKRHRHTAEIALAAMGCDLEIAVDEGWNEYDFDMVAAALGPLEPESSMQALFEKAIARWVLGGDGYRESWANFRDRVMAALARIGAALGKSESAIVFTSGGPISTVAGALLHVPEAKRLLLGWTLANCGITKLIGRGESLHLSTLNEHAHFERGLVSYR